MLYYSMDQKSILFDQILKSYTINGINDTESVIGRAEAIQAKPVVLKLRNDIIKNYPKNFTKKLRCNKEFTDKDLVTILRQLCRFHHRCILSNKKWKWNKIKKRQYCVYQYQLI